MNVAHILATPGINGPRIFSDQLNSIRPATLLCPGENLIYLRGISKKLFLLEILINIFLIAIRIIIIATRRRERVDCVIHSSINIAGIFGAIIVRPFVSRIIFIVHESHPNYIRLSSILSMACNEVYSVFSKELFSGRIRNYCGMVPLIVRSPIFNTKNAPRDGIVQIGNLSHVKNYEYTIGCVESGVIAGNDVKICGGILATQKEYGEKLVLRFKEIGIAYYGILEWNDICSVLSRSRYLLVTSVTEGFSTAILEGLVCGCLPLASNIPSNREVFSALSIPTQLLFDLDNFYSFKCAIKYGETISPDVIGSLREATIQTYSAETAANRLRL